MATPIYLSSRIKNTSCISTTKEVKSLINSTYLLMECEVEKMQSEIDRIKQTSDYALSHKKVQSDMIDGIAKTLNNEKRRLEWFLPFYVASGDKDNGIINLLVKLFKSHQCEWASLFHDLYSLAKLHRIMIGCVIYNPDDAHTNALALVEYISDNQSDQINIRDFFNYYNGLKIDRHAKRGADTGYTQSGKVFQICAKLGMGYYSGSPTGKDKSACNFFVNKDSELLKWMASKPSQPALKAFLSIQ